MRNVPNYLSLSRLVATVPLVVLVLINTPPAYLVAVVLYAAAAFTDLLDGRIARRYSIVSNLGVFLDLTADKVYVSGILIALVQVGLTHAWVPIIIITREFIVSALRSLAAAQGVVIPAGKWGKQKTTLTLIAIGGVLLAAGFNGHSAFPLGLGNVAHGPSTIADYLLVLSNIIMVLAVVWTIFSAVEYLRGGWKLLVTPAER